MKQMQPGLFENIAWSSDRVILQTIDACRRLRLKVHRLPQWYDVDAGEDLQQLRSDLAKKANCGPSHRGLSAALVR